MAKDKSTDFTDIGAETVINAGILQYGRDAFIDTDGIVDSGDFSIEWNSLIYRCAKEHYSEGTDRPLDYPTILSMAKRLGLSEAFTDDGIKKHIGTLRRYPVELSSVAPEAARLLKLKIGRELDIRLASARRNLRKLTGEEALDVLLGIVENPFFEYISTINGVASETQQIAVGLDEWFDDVVNNPRDNIGIPTPFPILNELIGGGHRRGGIAIVAARPKGGKTTYVDNLALHVAGPLVVPVFNVDTEMNNEGHWARILAHLTSIPIKKIERGRLDPSEIKLVKQKIKWLKTIPYHYKSVIDDTFEEQVAAMRRWIVKEVGTDENGRRNDCLIIYDYLQMTDPREFAGNKFAEYQILGFQMLLLARMAKRYDVPIVSMLQLNKEGWASGSDRIVWKCESFIKLERKTPEEMDSDGRDEGSARIVIEASRFGEGTEKGNYINLKFDPSTSQMSEGRTKFEADKAKGNKPSTLQTFETEYDEEDHPFGSIP